MNIYATIDMTIDTKFVPIHLLQALPQQPEVLCLQEVSCVFEIQEQPQLQLIDASVFPMPRMRLKIQTHTNNVIM